jgi:hypothetical protein
MATQDPVSDIKVGLAVFSLEGSPLGSVAEVNSGAFRVDVPLKPDFWLLKADALSFTDERVTMNFEKDDLGDHTHRAAEFEQEEAPRGH